MEISRLDAGAEPARLEPVDLGALVASVVREHGADGRIRVEEEPITLESDRRRLERILANLVGNALEHGGGEAAIRIASEDGAAVVEVSDRGPGIPPEHLPHVFERFYKADPLAHGRGQRARPRDRPRERAAPRRRRRRRRAKSAAARASRCGCL